MIACFYAPAIGLAVEQERKPDLAGHPVAITQDAVLVAASPEAERCGIKPGQKETGAQGLCRDLILLPYDREAYSRAARRMWNLCAIESSVVEPLSPEICFVELSGFDQEMRARILHAEISSRISADVYGGLAYTKFVAKEAAQRPCEERFLFVDRGTEAALLYTVAIPISFLDQKAADRLEKLGIRTLGDIQRLPHGELERQVKQYALRLRRLANGQDSETVRALWPPRTLEHYIDFDEEVIDSSRIELALQRCSKRIARMLGREYARTVRLVVHHENQLKRSAFERLPTPISAPADLYLVAIRLLNRLTLSCSITGLRLSVRDVDIGSAAQLRLLDDNDYMAGLPHERQAALETAQQFLQVRYGALAMDRAAAHSRLHQTGLTLSPLGRRLNEPVEVSTESGAPVCFLYRNRSHLVTGILDRWKHTECKGDTVCEHSSFRVSYGKCAIADLQESPAGWRLIGLGD